MANNILNIAIGVVTAPRVKNTAQRMLMGLRYIKNRPSKIHVFAEPNSDIIDADYLTIHQNETTKGCFKNFYHAYKWLLDNTTSEYVLVLADDIKYNADWLDKATAHMAQLNPHKTGYLALYTPMGMRRFFKDAHGRTPERITMNYGYGGGGWGGCYLMHRDVAQQVFNHPAMLNHYQTYTKNQQFDEIVKECCHQLGLNQYYINPSLFDHVGTHSTIGHQNRGIDKGLNFARA